MLVMAACADGVGNTELASWFDHSGRDAHIAALRARFSVPGQTALALREHAERLRISLRMSASTGRPGSIEAATRAAVS